MERRRKPVELFSPEEDRFIREAWCKGFGCTEIAKVLGRPRTSVQSRKAMLGLGELPREPKTELPVPEGGPILVPPKVEIHPRTQRALINNLPHATLVYGDTHFPFHDPRAMEVLYKFCELVEVDEVVHLGDLVDNWQISDYLPPDERKLTGEQRDYSYQLRASSGHLAQITQLTPEAKRYFLHGNHEDRWSRMLRAAQTDSRWRHVLSLPRVQDAMDLNVLLNLKDCGFQPVEYAGTLILHDRVVAVHGDRIGVWISRIMLQKYGKSVVFGHAHIVQSFTVRDLRGTDSAWCVGCLCDLNPFYAKSPPNWAQGFALIVWDDPRDHFVVLQMRIHDGRCVTPWGVLDWGS